MRCREMLVRVLPAGKAPLGRHTRAHPALLGVVDDRHLREVPNAPAGALDPQADVGLLRVDEESLVQKARALERLTAGQHERSRGPVAVSLALIGGRVEDALAGP